MTKWVLSAVIVLGVILDGVLGFGFLTAPLESAAGLGMSAEGAAGRATLRGDMTAFFWVAAGFMLAGAIRQRGDWLVAPLALFLAALTGRALDLLLAGPYDGWWVPMSVEAAHVAVLAGAIAVFGWRGGAEGLRRR